MSHLLFLQAMTVLISVLFKHLSNHIQRIRLRKKASQ
jgi:hypothetical protein